MRKGKTYEVTFQIPGSHKKPRTMTAKYVATEPKKATPGLKTVTIWDLRPLSGTTSIEAAHVISTKEAPGAAPSLPRIIR